MVTGEKKKKNLLKEKAIKLADEGKLLCDIVDELASEFNCSPDNIYDRVQKYVKRHRVQNNIVQEKRVAIQNQEPSEHSSVWNGTETLKFAIIGDTQLGSKYTQWTHLKNFYDICEEEGITDVYHTGDITDGLKMRTGHEYE